MKRLLLILILTFSFQSFCKAADISDFEIEGMSVGDSLLDYFDKNEILNKHVYKNKKFATHYGKNNDFKNYEGFQIFYLSKDIKYKIHYLAGINLYPNNTINKCYKKMYKIADEIKKEMSFDNYKDTGNMKNPFNDNTKNFAHNLEFYFLDGSSLVIACMDYDEKLLKDGYTDKLTVSLSSNEFTTFLSSGDAYK